MTVDVVALSACVFVYGLATFLLAAGSAGGLAAASHDRAWLAGTGLQGVGFLLAFLARRSLPLLIVQPVITSSVAVAYLVGVLTGRWRLRGRDGIGLGLTILGIAGLGVCARPGPAVVPGTVTMLALLTLLVACAATGRSAVRSSAPVARRALAAGAAAGIAFGLSAVGARAVAGDLVTCLGTTPGRVAVLLVVLGIVFGQALLTAALSTGRMAGPVSVLHVTETVGPALVGLWVLGDELIGDRLVPALACTALALTGSLLLADHSRGDQPLPDPVAQ